MNHLIGGLNSVRIIICLCCWTILIEHYSHQVIQMNQQTPLSKAEERRRIIREFTNTNELSTLQEISKYTKLLGTYLIKGLQTFTSIFKRRLETQSFSERNENDQGNIPSQERNLQKRKGFKVNFQSFDCPESQLQVVSFLKNQKQDQEKPVRTFHFNIEDFQDQQSIDVSQREELSLLLSRIGQKKIKREEVNTKDEGIPQLIRLENEETRQHWTEIYNQVNLQWALMVSNMKEKCEKDKKKQVVTDQSRYKSYLQNIGQGLLEGKSSEDPNKRLASLIRTKRQRVQQRPPRKMTHVEKETPQIYSVKTVLQVLEKQKNQFINDKKRIIEQKLRVQREAQRAEEEARLIQEKLRKEQLEQQRRQEQLKRLQEIKLVESQKSSELQAGKNQFTEGQLDKEIKKQLNVIEQKEEIGLQKSQSIQQNEGFSLRRQRNLNNEEMSSPKSVAISSSREKNVEEAQPESKQSFMTPNKQEPNEKVPAPEVIIEQKPLSEKKNPFIRSSPAKVCKLDDLINNDSKSNAFAPFMTSPPSTNLFANQNSSTSNIFASQTGPIQQDKSEAPQLFNSPTNFLNNRIGGRFAPAPANATISVPSVPQFGSPNSLVNNIASSFQPSNLGGSSFMGSDNSSNFASQSNQSFQGGSLMNIGGSMGFSNLSGHSNPAKLFESNMFMPQSQPRSLFGEPPPPAQTGRDYGSRGAGTRAKKSIRIS